MAMDMDIISLHNFLKEVENLQMFSLCKDFDNLSLEDGRSSSESSSTSSSSSSLVSSESYSTSFLLPSSSSYYTSLVSSESSSSSTSSSESYSTSSSSSYSTSLMLPSSESYYTILGIVQPSSESSSTSSSSSYSTSLVSSESSSTSLVQPSSESSSTSLVQPSSYGYSGDFHRFLRSWTLSPWSQAIIEQLRSPFIELPRDLMNSSFKSYDIYMGLGFRFLPGQSQFLNQELNLPESFDRLSFLSHSLGLSYYSRPISAKLLFPSSCSGAGLRGFVTDRFTKILVEVITYNKGRYGRFLVLVILGVGCTVWYGFAPGTALQGVEGGLFTPCDSYDPFFNMNYHAPGFSKVGFVERNDVSASVESAFENELPFAEITIPASGHVLKAVGLGLMVAFFLTIGLVPNVSGSINL